MAKEQQKKKEIENQEREIDEKIKAEIENECIKTIKTKKVYSIFKGFNQRNKLNIQEITQRIKLKYAAEKSCLPKYVNSKPLNKRIIGWRLSNHTFINQKAF